MPKLITCVYNPSHQIRPERIHYHYVKCAKQHPHMDMVICPYNATHHIHRVEEGEHILKCPDRIIMELERYRFNEPVPGQHGMFTRPTVYGSDLIPKPNQDSSDQETSEPSWNVQHFPGYGTQCVDREVAGITKSMMRRPIARSMHSSPDTLSVSSGHFVQSSIAASSTKTSPYPTRRFTSSRPRTSSIRKDNPPPHSLNVSLSEISPPKQAGRGRGLPSRWRKMLSQSRELVSTAGGSERDARIIDTQVPGRFANYDEEHTSDCEFEKEFAGLRM